MFYAWDEAGNSVEAQPGLRATCPLCRRCVIAKCGAVVEWHWAHVGEGESDCDSWAESETPWHRWWKTRAPLDWREVSMGEHRADIRRDQDGYVIELQHSPISQEDIQNREAFYKRMIWLLDGRLLTRQVLEFDEWVPRLREVRQGRWEWNRPRKSFLASRKKIFIDLGAEVLEVFNFFADKYYCTMRRREIKAHCVEGRMLSRDQFIERARLRPLEDFERIEEVSLVAEWRTKVNAHDSAAKDEAKETLRRREFGSEAALARWLAKAERKDLTLLHWMGSGILNETDIETSRCASARIKAATQHQ